MYRKILGALVLAVIWLMAGPFGPAGPRVSAHAELLSSVPGAGEAVETAPTELRLVFSEPLEPSGSSVDLLDGDGRAIVVSGGTPSPDDDHVLIVPVPEGGLPDGAYTVNWRSLSAADGHATQGFFTFATGNAELPPGTDSSLDPAGALHAGHSPLQAVLESVGRGVSFLGFMFAFGLGVIGLVVVRPVDRGLLRPLALGTAALTVGGIVGTLLLIQSIGSRPETDLAVYLTDSRTGQLLLVRIAVAAIGGLLVLAATLWWRFHEAFLSAVLVGLAGIVTAVAGGHAAGYPELAPLIAAVVHVAAAGVWVSGLAVLVWVAARHVRSDGSTSLPALVPRFSALALVSVGLFSLTGIYASWVQTRELVPTGTEYASAWLLKMVLVAAALVIGAVNLRDGGRDRPRFGRLRTRLIVETGLAIAVVIATGNLTSGSPPGLSRPVEIAATGGFGASLDAQLGVQPGRPGPNRQLVTLTDPPAGTASVTIVMQRLDLDQGTSRIPLRPLQGADQPIVAGSRWVMDGGQLFPDSQWDVTVAALDGNGMELARQRFVFGLDAESIISGRAAPTVDPVLVVGLLLLLGGALSAAYGAIVGGIPGRRPVLGRRVLIVAGGIAVPLGIVMLFVGPRI